MPRTDSGWSLIVPLLITGSGLGLLVSQLNNYTLSPIEEERVSEAAGVNSAAGSFGLSFGLAMAGGIMLAVLSFSFTYMTDHSAVIPPAQQEQISTSARGQRRGHEQHPARSKLVGQPKDVQAEILRINTDARNRSLQVRSAHPRARESRSDWPTASACGVSQTSNPAPTSRDSTSPERQVSEGFFDHSDPPDRRATSVTATTANTATDLWVRAQSGARAGAGCLRVGGRPWVVPRRRRGSCYLVKCRGVMRARSR